MRDRVYIKDLRILNRSIDKCIAIDNSIVAFMSQLDNLLHIKSFMGINDCELMETLNILSNTSYDDVREQIKEKNLIPYLLKMCYI